MRTANAFLCTLDSTNKENQKPEYASGFAATDAVEELSSFTTSLTSGFLGTTGAEVVAGGARAAVEGASKFRVARDFFRPREGFRF